MTLGLGASPSFAAITITGADGASATNLASGVTPAIYGGLAGTCVADTLVTCDSCATAVGLEPCNRARINPALRLRIAYNSNAVAGRPILTNAAGTFTIYTSPTSVAKGSTAVVDATWGTICPYLTVGTGDATCISTTSGASISDSLKIGIDVNTNGILDTGDESTTVQITVLNPDPLASGDFDTIEDCATNLTDNKPGICYFMAYPGDQKIFFEDSESGAGFPTTALGTVTKINVYASTTGFITKPSDATPSVLTVENTEITNKVINGLENGVPHYFRVSVSDPAGNEVYFTSDNAITTACGSLTPTAPFDGTGGGTLCPFAAIPDEVVGLLTKNVNCFIATAAFGSPLHPLVEDFRQFRDQFLIPHKWGRQFVNWYYGWSPDAAHWLRHHDWSKTAVRAALIPVWLGTKAIIWWPISLGLLLVFFTAWRRYKIKVKSA